ncbi:solute carrier family 2, facilitated glucose transporter member 3-like isoform X2 [Xenia sp. Carnegie-2017]|uniref:solute carrier family 2, facilitated glucose transporter member 3-like isoform X2 n=1 Tax=Xenia sp. Carnegie-2017 TaxID=2897299 RepID=UPI001F040B73|nr:solute carrier family 2, facilitated glucose transporter member 3-like isoform X2 [Xenia sp. Carnegie-2017]
MEDSQVLSEAGDSACSKETDESTPLTGELKSQPPGGITTWLFLTTLITIFGSSFQFGYNVAVVNTPEKEIRHYFKSHNVAISDIIWSTAVSITSFGGLIGAIIGPIAADMLGRKATLLWDNAVIIVGCVLVFSSRFALSTILLIFGRFIIGVSNGIVTVVVPMYLSEISPTNLRGAVGTLNQFGIVFGMLIANILGLHQILGTSKSWHYLLSFSIVPALIQIIVLPFCPLSPRYLLITLNKESLARTEVIKLQGSYNVETIISEMRHEKETILQQGKLSILQLLQTKSLRRPLLLGVLLQLSQQFSGINALMFYSTSTFTKAGMSNPDVATCGVGTVSVVMVAVSVFLMDRVGRRSLMLIGLAGMFVFYGIITISYALQDKYENFKYLAVACTFITMAFFQIGPGSIPWFMVAEFFSQGPRPAATSISGSVNWLSGFIVAITFPSIQDVLFPYVFIVFMVFILVLWTLIFIYVPETKGKTFEEISRELLINSYEVNNDTNHSD